MSEAFRQQLLKIGEVNRTNGRQEFRIAAMRWLTARGLRLEAKEIGNLDVDAWLTLAEISKRNEIP